MLNHREQLQAIRTFPQLIKYLRDELDWPISQDDFEDLTFEYSPEELGIDVTVAAKIQEIRRLRPLSVHQPWGIFFVKFEPKRLPVVAMRRMLNAVAIKNRASAANADRITWASDDLLFISNYGEEENRQITFAHFTQNQVKKDLPTLKVLGWDNKDTALHMDYVAENFNSYLKWPEDEAKTDVWRRSWRSAFTLKHREVIDTAKKLSVQLAHLARNIRERINTVLDYETESGPITKLMNAFKEALVHDLDNDGFADMYAQTIAYGLLSARISNPSGKTADDFASAMPVTNPFLKELMETFIDVGVRNGNKKSSIRLDFDELGVSEVVELLDEANMEAVVRDFGDKNPLEDPVTHFYEQFFADYDNSERFKRGVFYTPRPVVSFIVRSVDQILKDKFGLDDGLADTTTWGEMIARNHDLEVPEGINPKHAFVQILDPATGTGTFLVEVINLIHVTMIEKWKSEGKSNIEIESLWNDYVPKYLLPRLHGYELMMAPYAIAHMKLGLKLYETGYNFASEERARVFLTNSLEPISDYSDRLAFAIPALAHEAQAVNLIKQNQKFTVIIGNPPYSVSSQNKSEFIEKLMGEYKEGLSNIQNLQPLSDDYVKFIRYAHNLIDSAKHGLLGFITNHSYLSGVIHKTMRKQLLNRFTHISILDLHGNTFSNEHPPGGVKDKNVFEIQQGVSIFIGTTINQKEKEITFSELWGERSAKHATLHNLCNNIPRIKLQPQPEYYFFVPKDFSGSDEYEQWPSVEEAFKVNKNGIQTGHDNFVVDVNPDNVRSRIETFLDSNLSDEDVQNKYSLKNKAGWEYKKKRKALIGSTFNKQSLLPYYYRPFDIRYIYYDPQFLKRSSPAIMPHLRGGHNVALFTMRKIVPTFEYTFFGVVDSVVDHGYFYMGNQGSSSCFPLYLNPEGADIFGETEKENNFSKSFLEQLASTLSIEQRNKNGVPAGLSPEIILNYIYAVFHSVKYRTQYAEFLKIDFPRIPLTSNKDLFKLMAKYGENLITLHLFKSDLQNNHSIRLIGDPEYTVDKVSYSEDTVWIDGAKSRGFEGVSKEVWNHKIGGYQVCEKWLKDRQAKGGKNPRPGRVLTQEDIEHYQKIIVAISETIRIMGEIDEVIEAHGGWPGAFQTN